MRRNEITPELIELSKRAKTLGFPQDVDEGDWTYLKTDAFGENLILVTAIHNNTLCEKEFLILSFSRCLEWLEERFDGIQILRKGNLRTLWMRKNHDYDYKKYIQGKMSRDELGAKAVVKILEEQ